MTCNLTEVSYKKYNSIAHANLFLTGKNNCIAGTFFNRLTHRQTQLLKNQLVAGLSKNMPPLAY
jgi:hypothetical protein